MIDFSTLQGLTIPEGVVTQIKDAQGNVLWKKIVAGSVIWRPSADISIEHSLYPASSDQAYKLINEEVSDGDSTYIWTDGAGRTSKFKLDGNSPPIGATITSVTIFAERWSETLNSQSFTLEVNGVQMPSVTLWGDESKAFSGIVMGAIAPINDYFAVNKRLPDINITIKSNYSGGNNNSGKEEEPEESGITQIYVVLTYG